MERRGRRRIGDRWVERKEKEVRIDFCPGTGLLAANAGSKGVLLP